MGPPGFEMRNMTRERCDMNEEKYAASWGVYRVRHGGWRCWEAPRLALSRGAERGFAGDARLARC